MEKPPRNVCFVCKKEGEALPRCQRCRSVPYCSRECQTQDWKAHKQICLLYVQHNLGKDTTTTFGEKGKKSKKGKQVRTRQEIISDLSRYASLEPNYPVMQFTFLCWHAMDLFNNIDKAKTHFVGVVLRSLYTLVDAEEKKFEAAAIVSTSGPPIRMSPLDILRQDAARRLEDGGLGSTMVVSTEFDENAPHKSVEQYIAETANPTMQPLGLFKVHRDSALLRQLISLSGSNWKLCLKNALGGGGYSPVLRPYR
ncbi:hypothetical protein C8J57DRAFT_1346185, partial [Mycena rebaudengoi]